ncbi:nematocyst expressed protein 3-like [Plodia interpunctella]|uniref:nematocyst expressed protein 3-like n=1 Tax=Plodia interpunctella TaxID=58824 RepID=UPI002367CF5D|nr:nematocyst expressed protein 3-like [Plodia interpunctella]
MFSIRSIVLIAAAFAMGDSSGVPAVAAPLVAPAHVGYAHAVPQNIPPYAAQVNTFNRALNPVVAAPLAAAPAALAAPVAAPLAVPFAAPVAAPLTAPVAGPFAAPYLTGPAPYTLPAPYAAPFPYGPYAAPFPYGSAPLVRAPYGIAPAFVR